MLIDCTYFERGPLHIQNATLGKVPNVNAQETRAAIESYIKKYQWPFLKGVLGAENAQEETIYLETIENNAWIEHPVWSSIAKKLREPFAHYVYYKILRSNQTQATITGLVLLKSANEYVSPITKQVTVWNEMVDMIADFAEWCQTPACPIPGIIPSRNFLTKINSLNL